MKLQDILKDVLDDEIGEPQSVEVIVTELKEAEEKISLAMYMWIKERAKSFLY